MHQENKRTGRRRRKVPDQIPSTRPQRTRTGYEPRRPPHDQPTNRTPADGSKKVPDPIPSTRLRRPGHEINPKDHHTTSPSQTSNRSLQTVCQAFCKLNMQHRAPDLQVVGASGLHARNTPLLTTLLLQESAFRYTFARTCPRSIYVYQ